MAPVLELELPPVAMIRSMDQHTMEQLLPMGKFCINNN